MTEMLQVTVEGQPLPMPRAQRKGNRVYMPADYLAYREKIAWAIRKGMGHREPAAGEVAVTVEFCRKDRRRVDADNLLKTCFDAMQGTLCVDDSQITEVHVYKRHGYAQPKIEITATWERA